MTLRVVVLLTLATAIGATPALAGGGYGDQKAHVDAKIAALHSKIASSQAKAVSLSSEIGSLTTQIHALDQRVGNVSAQLSALQSDLALHKKRLDKLDALFHVQTVRFTFLKRQYALAVERLNLRLVDIYKSNQPTAVDVVLQAKSFSDVMDQLDYLSTIANQDKSIAFAVSAAKKQVRVQRKRTMTIRRGVKQETAVIDARVQQAAILRGELLSTQSKLKGARSTKNHALVITQSQVQDEIDESKSLEAASAQLAARLQGDSGGSPPVAGGNGTFQWPVSGPITSPFGMRWGTLHPGIDIGVPTGTPIHAAGSGTVVWCGWMSGYGNLVMIDHHNGLATLYGHESHVAVACGQNVTTGEVVGYSGCTGFCTGPHVHFEVRANGTPVDPLGYLP
ncbi:MAG TPA: peptidoglycan DD-metalloendopeptidase family protein [Gaiellaceae bacterium]|nr:peptidoglycan DD-metalloendopeptidase family protein [Gaiellaceae bacterium]